MSCVFVEGVWPIVGYYQRPVIGRPMLVTADIGEGARITEELVNIVLTNQRMRISYMRGSPEDGQRVVDAHGAVVGAHHLARFVSAEAVVEGAAGESLVEPTTEEIGNLLLRRFDAMRARPQYQHRSQGSALLGAVGSLCSTLVRSVKSWPALMKADDLLYGSEVTSPPESLLAIVVVVRGLVPEAS